MFLALDVGNTNTMLGIYRGKKLIRHWRVSTDHKKTADEYGVLFANLFCSADLSPNEINSVMVSSVVPPVNGVLERAIETYIEVLPRFVGPGIKTGLNIKVDNPREVGADRIVNAVAVYNIYGGPAIILDFGTATTFCALSAEGHYYGGAIAPGLELAVEALVNKASQLPRIKIRETQKAIGANTVAAMEAGIYFGFIGQVRELIKRMKTELGGDPKIIATGGLAGTLAGEALECVDHVHHYLTLEGLRFLEELNSNER